MNDEDAKLFRQVSSETDQKLLEDLLRENPEYDLTTGEMRRKVRLRDPWPLHENYGKARPRRSR